MMDDSDDIAICRLCLKTCDTAIDIFNPNGSFGLLVWKVIMELMQLDVCEADGLPNTICGLCMDKIKEFKYFKTMCISSKIQFMKALINKGMVDGPVSPILPNTGLPTVSNSVKNSGDGEENMFEEDNISIKEEKLSDTEESISSGHDPDYGLSSFQKVSNKLSEEAAIHESGRGFKNREETFLSECNLLSPTDSNRQDERLGPEFPLVRRLTITSGTVDEKLVLKIIPKGNNESKSIDEAGLGNRGMKDESLGSLDLSSEDMGAIGSTYTVTNVEDSSSSGLKSVRKLTPTISSEGMEIRFVCDVCNKTFGTKKLLVRHVKTHNRKHPHKCNQCGLDFASKASLKFHKKRSHKLKTFHCYECNKEFTQSGHLHRHERTHLRSKPYKCDDCDKSFTRIETLRVHLRVHSGKKMFKCRYCDLTFTQSGNRVRHERIHTGHKPYKCIQCDKSFIQSCDLKKHIVTHFARDGQQYQDSLFQCSWCPKIFLSSRSLRRHESMKHKP